MMLAIVGEGTLGARIKRALEEHTGSASSVRTASAGDGDLFERATGTKVVVHAPEPRLLDGYLSPAPDPERMARVIGAANAPGVELLVYVRPCPPHGGADPYSEEERLLRKSGKAYVIVRCPPLFEEIAEAAHLDESDSLTVPKGRSAAAISADVLAEMVVQAVSDDNLVGRTLHAPAEPLDLDEVIRRAAKAVGREVMVKPSSGAGLYLKRAWAALFAKKRRDAMNLCERLAIPAAAS